MVTVADIVAVLIRHVPRAVVPVSNVAIALKVDAETVREAVGRSEAEDRALLWPEFDGLVMSIREAESHRLELHCPSDDQINPQGWRWLPAGRAPREKPNRRLALTADVLGVGEAELIAGYHPYTPDDSPAIGHWLATQPKRIRKTKLDRDENRNRRIEILREGRHCERTPRIRAVGISRIWSADLEVPGNPDCEVCGGADLGLLGYCLGCSRSGLDPWLPEVTERDIRRLGQLPKAGKLAGGTGRRAS